jgi:hypothetical protein
VSSGAPVMPRPVPHRPAALRSAPHLPGVTAEDIAAILARLHATRIPQQIRGARGGQTVEEAPAGSLGHAEGLPDRDSRDLSSHRNRREPVICYTPRLCRGWYQADPAARRLAVHHQMPRPMLPLSHRRAALTRQPGDDDRHGAPFMPVGAPLRVTPPVRAPHRHYTIGTQVRVSATLKPTEAIGTL